jgi:hypothetical protein
MNYDEVSLEWPTADAGVTEFRVYRWGIWARRCP